MVAILISPTGILFVLSTFATYL